MLGNAESKNEKSKLKIKTKNCLIENIKSINKNKIPKKKLLKYIDRIITFFISLFIITDKCGVSIVVVLFRVIFSNVFKYTYSDF